MNGSLSEGVLPGVLRELYTGRRTGALLLERGTERHGLQFRKGVIVRGETSVTQERLGETLVRHGLLSALDLARATEIEVRDGKRLGEVLLELGAIDKQRVEDGLALQVRDILRTALSWGEGVYRFEEQPAQDTLDSELTLKLPTGELILEAARLVTDADVVHFALGDVDRVLGLSSDPLLRFQHITLTPADGYILSRIDGTLSAREVIQLIPMPAEDVERSLFGLLSTGVVEFLPLPPKPAPPPVARRTTPSPAVVKIQAPQLPAAAAATSPPSPESEARDARRREILETFDGLKARNHFEALEIPKASNETQVKEAYFRLARKFHPDTHHDPSLADLRDKIEAIFIRLGEAYDVLRDRNRRSSYESDLASRMPRALPGSPAAATSEPHADAETESRIAEESIRRAERYLTEERYWDAIQLLEPALPGATGQWKPRARLALARGYLKNPRWLKRAEEQLQSLLREDARNVDAYFLLGTLYKQGGLRSRALSMFRKVLELRPEHEQAASEVAGLTPGESVAPPDNGGLLKKLFGRS